MQVNLVAHKLESRFSEREALCLQELLLTPGEHQVQVKSILQGRQIMADLLSAVKYYQNPACLSLESLPVNFGITDIVKTLIMDDYLITPDRLALFFLDCFYYDFLWIEETQALLDSIWYEQFKVYLVEFSFQKSIPIIKITV
jgi:hypothetical protein